MEVILREHVENLGERGEIVKVADGYARNYLLPRKLALPANAGNRKHVERERKIVEARESEEKGKAEAIAAKLSAIDVSIARRVGDTEQLYGSVTSGDIADFLKAKGFEIDRRKLILPEPIKAIGEHTVPLKLHREVTVPLKVRVVKEGGRSAAAQEPAKDAGKDGAKDSGKDSAVKDSPAKDAGAQAS
jgi:large subunit ribosomal protein L9